MQRAVSSRQAELAASRRRMRERGGRARAQAIRVYDRLRAQGLSPNSTTYNARITAHGKACNLEMARAPANPTLTLTIPRPAVGLSNRKAESDSGSGVWVAGRGMAWSPGCALRAPAHLGASAAPGWEGLHCGMRCAWCFVSCHVRVGHAAANWVIEPRTDTPDECGRACGLSMARPPLQTWNDPAGV